MTTARLYYEAHITVEESTEVPFEDFAGMVRDSGWKASRFSEDEVDDYNGKWFMSYRGEDLEATMGAVKAGVLSLGILGHTILRWKIEDTLLDSKHGDTL
jgi:hypothetical protein